MFVTILVASLMIYGVYLAIRPEPVVYDPYPGFVQVRRTSSTTTTGTTRNPYMWTTAPKFKRTTKPTTTKRTTIMTCRIDWESDDSDYYDDDDTTTEMPTTDNISNDSNSTTSTTKDPGWFGRRRRHDELANAHRKKGLKRISVASRKFRNKSEIFLRSSNLIKMLSRFSGNLKVPRISQITKRTMTKYTKILPRPDKVAKWQKTAGRMKKNVTSQSNRSSIRRRPWKIKNSVTSPKQKKRHILIKLTTHSFRDFRKKVGKLKSKNYKQ